MKLFEQIIQKEYELYTKYLEERKYAKSLWHFYGAYNIARALLQKHDPDIKKKNALYKKFIDSKFKIDSKYFKKLQTYVTKDTKVIMEAMLMINKLKAEAGFEFGEFYKPGTVGVIFADYPE